MLSAVVQRLIEKRQDETVGRIKWLMRLERRPYTQNHHYLTSYRDKFLSKYRGERRKKNTSQTANKTGTGNPMTPVGQQSPMPWALDSPVMNPYASPISNAGAPNGQPRGPPLLRQPSRSNSMPVPPSLGGQPQGQQPQQQPQQRQGRPNPQEQYMQQMREQQEQQAMQRQMQQATPNLENLISQLAAAGFPVQNSGDLERLFASDPYEEVLIVMAEVRSYWQVAYKVSFA